MYDIDDFEGVYDYYSDILSSTVAYMRTLASHVILWSIAYVCLCLALYLWGATKCRWRPPRMAKARRAMLAIAHPDDECMFFGPTVYGMLEQAVDVHILCLSDGDNEGLGNVRRKELWNACAALGIPSANVCLMTDERLPDAAGVQWPAPVTAHILLQRLEAYDIDVLITFDKDGVSGHANHASLFYAVAYLFLEKKIPKNCSVYALDSVNILRKYWGYLDLPLSYLLSSNWYFLSWRQSRRIVRAMKQHRSQMVWFRQLYVMFSRYMLINTLREINLVDIELELSVED